MECTQKGETHMIVAPTEQVTLLGNGQYKNIPDVLNISAIPGISELRYVSAEDVDTCMLDEILPQVVKEKINFRELLSIDYEWLCRCIRLLSYGPYHSTNMLGCSDCNEMVYGDYLVDLRTVPCEALPEKWVNDIVIPSREFLDTQSEIRFQLDTIQTRINAFNDKLFKRQGSKDMNRELAIMSYTITAINGKTNLTPIEVKLELEKLSAIDYTILVEEYNQRLGFGLGMWGKATCPKCKGPNGRFLALADDKFFRPSVLSVRKWRDDCNRRKAENASTNKANLV